MPTGVEMMQATELLEKYQQVVKTAPSPEALEAAGEVIVVLHKTRWARILLVWRVDDPEQIIIEVEVSLPQAIKEARQEESVACGDHEGEMGEMLTDLMKHQQYLLRLKRAGFVLDVIRQDCLWTASGTFSDQPSKEVFDLLIPP
jgi:hypothetical protein